MGNQLFLVSDDTVTAGFVWQDSYSAINKTNNNINCTENSLAQLPLTRNLARPPMMGDLLLKTVAFSPMDVLITKLQEENRLLTEEIDELSSYYRNELRIQYMKIHDELGDQILHLKSEHRMEIAKLKEELADKTLKISSATKAINNMKQDVREHREGHICVRLQSKTFKVSLLRGMDRVVTFVVEMCTSSYGFL